MILPTVKDLSGPFKSYNLNNGAHQASTDGLRSRVRRLPPFVTLVNFTVRRPDPSMTWTVNPEISVRHSH